MSTLNFEPLEFPRNAPELRQNVRGFLSETLARRTVAQRARSWSAFDAEFSRALGRRGWIGMTWPRIYGGQDRSAIERYVVLEELLAAGAPVGAHWIADRQSGPLLLRFGTDEQKRRLLPDMARWQRELAPTLTMALISRGTSDENRAKGAEHGLTQARSTAGRAAHE